MKSLPSTTAICKIRYYLRSLHELIRNAAKQVIDTALVKLSLKPYCNNMFNTALLMSVIIISRP
ncbi:MAG: hypothetical protein ACTS73_03855 [Arsenophonus sp. NEOnobi-MAG3]